jgi:hypothetical protein
MAFPQHALFVYSGSIVVRVCECATTLILSITSAFAGAVEFLELNEWAASVNFSLFDCEF